MRRVTGARQRHDEDLRFRQDAVQLFQRVHLVVGGVAGLFGAPHAPHHLGAQRLGAAGKVGADVAGAQHGDAAAADGAHAQPLFPLTRPHDLLKLRHLPQHHQRHHEDVLGNGDAVGAGGVGEHNVFAGINVLVHVGVHTGKAAAEPLEIGRRFQFIGRAQAVNDLVLRRSVRRQVPFRVVVHGKAAFRRRFLKGRPMLRRKEGLHCCNFFHFLYASHIFSAQRIPSAAAERMPPA